VSVDQANFATLELLLAATVAQLILGDLIMSELIQIIEVQRINSCLQPFLYNI